MMFRRFTTIAADPRSGVRRRHHLNEASVQKAVALPSPVKMSEPSTSAEGAPSGPSARSEAASIRGAASADRVSAGASVGPASIAPATR